MISEIALETVSKRFLSWQSWKSPLREVAETEEEEEAPTEAEEIIIKVNLRMAQHLENLLRMT
jgi:hypothetical protein